MKLPEEKAKEFVSTLEEFAQQTCDDKVATTLFVKEEIGLCREELKREIKTVRDEVQRAELSLTKAFYWSGLIQFVAIIGSVVAIFNFMLYK